MSIPGYDAWKLATPPEYEWPDDLCEDCGGAGILEQECTCEANPETCLSCLGEDPPCRSCGGSGGRRYEEDGDEMYDRRRDRAVDDLP
jgi:hypothetical protein